MTLENEIFDGSHFNIQKGLEYGFIEENGIYTYSEYFMEDAFQAILTIKNEKVSGSLIEVELQEEYLNLRIDSFKGEFVYQVREAYFEILHDIKQACFDTNPFRFDQTNRIASYIQKMYQVKADNPFEEEGYRVFRDMKNQKWFGLVTYLNGKRFNKEGNIEILNVKLEPEHIQELLQTPSFYPAYHMDKKNWISIVLDETLEDSLIFACINESYSLVSARQYWIVPANPKYYDIFTHFESNEEITWKQTTKVNVDDILYIYVTQPYRCIFYKCIVTEIDIPYSYSDDNLTMKKVMKCRLLHKYKEAEIPMDTLTRLGIPNIRCTRKVSKKLIKQFDTQE